MIENMIEKSDKISLDFDLIRDDVKENILTSIQYKNKPARLSYILVFALYTLVLCMITIFITVNIVDNGDENSQTIPSVPNEPIGCIDPGKFPKNILNDIFDTFIAFGSETNYLFTEDVLLNMNMISENDKNLLMDYILQNTGQEYYNIHLGVKDGKDIIYIKHLTFPYGYFIFESNLDYEFLSIITEFENMCGKELTQEFLMKNEWDDTLQSTISGIHLKFKIIEEVYIPYYVLMIDGHVYILDIE